jgi:hypothetical protein
VVTKRSHDLGPGWVIGEHGATLAGRNVFDGMEAQGREPLERAHAPAMIHRAERMRRILNDRKAPRVCDVPDRVVIAGVRRSPRPRWHVCAS